MKTYKIYSVSQVLTVQGCKDQDEAIKKTGLAADVIFRIEQVPSTREGKKNPININPKNL